MRQIICTLTLILLSIFSFAQTSILTKEIKIRYTNGNAVFNICTSGCASFFTDNNEYFWYTEFSKIKSTKGGSGGNLLHGNFKFYDKNGNLSQDRNYYLGLLDGSCKYWDSIGNITSIEKFNKGVMIYSKFQNEEKEWIEFIGEILKVGSKRKVYSQYNQLLSEETMLPKFKQHVREFYLSGKLKKEYSTNDIISDNMVGKFTSYFENGNIEVDGQFYDEEYNSIKVGTWKWYNKDGSLSETAIYKAEVEKWANGDIKVAGGYVFDSDDNSWIKIGEWKWYNEDGTIQYEKKYKWGVEIKEE